MHNTHATHVLTVHMGRARHSRGPSGRLDATPLWPAQCPCARKAPGSGWGRPVQPQLPVPHGAQVGATLQGRALRGPKGSKGCPIQALSRAPLLSSGRKGGRRGPGSTGQRPQKATVCTETPAYPTGPCTQLQAATSTAHSHPSSKQVLPQKPRQLPALTGAGDHGGRAGAPPPGAARP